MTFRLKYQSNLKALILIGGLFSSLLVSSTGLAYIERDKIHLADSKKLKLYLRDGMVVGGDQAITDVIIKDIRRALNNGFERIVLDLEVSRNGSPVAVQRPPYFQLAVAPAEKRLVFHIWGKPKLHFDPKKVLSTFQRSAFVQKIILLPKVEEDLWTFSLELKSPFQVEVFELANPVRLIVDIQPKKG